MRRLVTALLAIAAVLAASVAAYAALGGADRSPAPRAAPEDGSPVRISGHVEGLYPGQETNLRIRVRNRTAGPVRIRWVQANVGRAGPECAAGWLQTQRIHPRARIPAGARLQLEIPVAMAAATPDGCQDATFPLRYRARVWTPETGQ